MLSTFSIVAHDPHNGDLGVAVQSKYFSVGPIVPWAQAGVGAIATQASANVAYGPEGLRLLAEGLSPDEVIRRLTGADERREHRQLGIVDATGNAAAHTGSECLPWAGSHISRDYSVQGNILASHEVVVSMAQAFETLRGGLADRLVSTLEAGQAAGGDIRGQQSAALLVVRKGQGRGGYGDHYVELRVEDHKQPIAELRRLLNLDYSNRKAGASHALVDEGKAEEAVSAGLQAVELSPENDVAHMALCRAYHAAGDTCRAAEALQAAANLNSMTPAYVRRIPTWRFLVEDERYRQVL